MKKLEMLKKMRDCGDRYRSITSSTVNTLLLYFTAAINK